MSAKVRLCAGAALLSAVACARSAPEVEVLPYPKAAYWEAFPLGPGGSAVFPDGLVVSFEGVPEDSRCPRGVECVWAGRAVVLLTVWTAAGESDSLSLSMSAGLSTHGQVFDYDIELRRLLPDPVEGVEIAPSEYLASLVVGKY